VRPGAFLSTNERKTTWAAWEPINLPRSFFYLKIIPNHCQVLPYYPTCCSIICMTASEKQKIAVFMDTAQDFFTSGYRTYSEASATMQKKYYFMDDDAPAVKPDQSDGFPVNVNDSAKSAYTGGRPVEQRRSNGSDDSLEKIAAEVKACNNCSLGGLRTNAAPGEGVTQPLVLVIGEGPGAEEDAQGRPFAGKAGQLLDKMLSSIELSRNTNCFIANVIKCRPPGNRDPYPEETSACAHFLERQIIQLKPKFILIAGRIAAQTLLKTTEPIGRLRGRFKELTIADMTIPLIITYHPAALLRNEDLKRPAWEDLKLLRIKIEEISGGN